MKRIIPSLIIYLSLLSASVSVLSADLTIEISELRNTKGSIQLAIYDNEEDFQSDASEEVFMAVSSKVTSKTLSYTIHDIPEGHYAVTVIHDENNSQNLDMSGRTPLEGLAYSGTKSKLTKPSFQRAATKVSKRSKTIPVKLNYYN